MATLAEIKEALKAGHISEDEAVDLVVALDKPTTTGQGKKLAGADNVTVPENKSLLDPRNWTPAAGIQVPQENAESALNPRNWNWKGTAAPLASMLAMAGTGGLSVPIQLGASGLASMGGDLLESGSRKLKGENISLPGAAESAAAQGGIDLLANALPGGRVIAQGMKSAMPFEKTGANMLLNQMGAPAAKTAARGALEEANAKGIGVPPSTFLAESKVKNALAKTAEGLAEWTNLGGLKMQSMRESFFNKVNREADQFVKDARNVGDVGGEVVNWFEKQSNKNIPESLRSKGSELYDTIYNPVGGKVMATSKDSGAYVPLNNLKATIQDVVAREGSTTGNTPALEKLKEIHLDGKGGPVLLTDVIEMYKKIKPSKYGSIETSNEIKGAIAQDIKDFNPEVHNLWETANKNFEALQEDFVKNSATKKIMGVMRGTEPGRKPAVKLDAVVTSLFDSAHLDDLEKIFKEMPVKMVDDLKTRFLANFFDPRSAIGKRVVGDVSDSTMQFIKGRELRQAIRDNQSILERLYPSETVAALRHLADKAELGSGITNKFITGSKESMGSNMTRQGMRMATTGGIGAMGGIPLAMATEGGGLFLANSLMKPNGWAKTLLVGGKEGTRAGAKGRLTMGGKVLQMGESVRERSNKAGKERGQ
jgi:hypothetical protein